LWAVGFESDGKTDAKLQFNKKLATEGLQDHNNNNNNTPTISNAP